MPIKGSIGAHTVKVQRNQIPALPHPPDRKNSKACNAVDYQKIFSTFSKLSPDLQKQILDKVKKCEFRFKVTSWTSVIYIFQSICNNSTSRAGPTF
jgi:hypothetical protein